MKVELAIDAEVDLGPIGDAYELAVRLNVSLPGIEREVAQRLVEAAHYVCPYSAEQRKQPRPVKTEWAKGSLEWLAQQNKPG